MRVIGSAAVAPARRRTDFALSPETAGLDYAGHLALFVVSRYLSANMSSPSLTTTATPEELEALKQFETEFAAEIAADQGHVYETVQATLDEQGHINPHALDEELFASIDGNAPPTEEKKQERLSKLQKINAMTVAEKVKLAVLGDKEDRMILVRDGSKVVNGAVLASPKISDQEVETIAAMKNVQENVLRTLARNRKFIKSYSVVKALVNNPRTPIDLSLPLMKNLLVNDLRALSMNKNVPETLKKLALKSYKEKTAPPGSR